MTNGTTQDINLNPTLRTIRPFHVDTLTYNKKASLCDPTLTNSYSISQPAFIDSHHDYFTGFPVERKLQ